MYIHSYIPNTPNTTTAPFPPLLPFTPLPINTAGLIFVSLTSSTRGVRGGGAPARGKGRLS